MSKKYIPTASEINSYSHYNPAISSTFYSFSFVNSDGLILLSSRAFDKKEFSSGYINSMVKMGNDYFSHIPYWNKKVKVIGKVPRGATSNLGIKSPKINNMTEIRPSDKKTIDAIVSMLINAKPNKNN
jgi:isopentenyldiphosphate isomerase